MDHPVDEHLGEQQQQRHEEQQLQLQPPPGLSVALAAANALLLSSSSAGHVPCTEDAQLLQHIAAYRASIEGISRQLDAAEQGVAPGSSIEPQQQQLPQGDAAAGAVEAATRPGADDAAALAGLGEEGVDYTVRFTHYHLTQDH